MFTRHPRERVLSGCAIAGLINRRGALLPGNIIIESINVMADRTTTLGAGFAAYGIYPKFSELYAFHIMYEDEAARRRTEQYLRSRFHIEHEEVIPTTPVRTVDPPHGLYRYFLDPLVGPFQDSRSLTFEDYVREVVMDINAEIDGAFVFSSGKNMGVFKGVGTPAGIAEFFCIADYAAYIWIAHGRFPTNTPGWWGGAHPFNMLNWSIVHNGEISSYGINKRYLEQFGYRCALMTDTEVMAYLVDLLIRVHGLSPRIACKVLAAPFWDEIDRADEEERRALEALRMTYASALVNGPFAIVVGFEHGIIALNDRIKLRPMIAAEDEDMVFVASEECAIRAVCPEPERLWNPSGGEPVIALLYDHEEVVV
ncbi:MAG: glutamine amidotransferase family protein [Planctomycetota bacterium]